MNKTGEQADTQICVCVCVCYHASARVHICDAAAALLTVVSLLQLRPGGVFGLHHNQPLTLLCYDAAPGSFSRPTLCNHLVDSQPSQVFGLGQESMRFACVCVCPQERKLVCEYVFACRGCSLM